MSSADYEALVTSAVSEAVPALSVGIATGPGQLHGVKISGRQKGPPAVEVHLYGHDPVIVAQEALSVYFTAAEAAREMWEERGGLEND